MNIHRVTPAKAGAQGALDSRLGGNDAKHLEDTHA